MLNPKEFGLEGIDWTGIFQERDSWRAVMSRVVKLWVPYNAVNFFTNRGDIIFQETICSIEYVSWLVSWLVM
jgi:hypothetical protein